MEKIIRQCCGVDVSKDMLDTAISTLSSEFETKAISSAQFENNPKGIRKLIGWLKRHSIEDLPLQTLMEATGIYHERLAYLLVEHGFQVAIVLPNKISNYCRSTDVRLINDKISARQIAEFGLTKKIKNWQKPDEALLRLKGLCRERNQLVNEGTRAKNQKHAKDYSSITNRSSMLRAEHHIRFLDSLIKDIEKEIKEVIKKEPWLNKKIDNICTIRGVGLITAVSIIAETDGFNLIRNSRQLVCYAGYDIISKTSGTSVHTKARISHKGNKNIRRALYFPAITAVKDGAYFGLFYQRLFERQGIKMKGYVAVQRKLLILIYTLWKKDETYNIEKHNSLKLLEQPSTAALTELDHIRS